MIEQVIEPFLSTQGKEAGVDYSNIYLVFPVLTTESNADTSIWLFPAVRMGLITRDEARAQLKFRGKAMKLEDIEFIDPIIRKYSIILYVVWSCQDIYFQKSMFVV